MLNPTWTSEQIEMFTWLVRGGLVLLLCVGLPVLVGLVIEQGRNRPKW